MKYSNGVFFETAHYIKHVHNYTLKQRIKYMLLWLIYWPLNIYQKILVLLINIIKRDFNFEERKYPVVIVTMFKNESLFLKEWIEYYKMIGVDHFFLYNNNSEDYYLDILRPYIKEGSVTLTDWPLIGGQIRAYEDWYNKYKNLCGYVVFIDIDEYICPIYDSNIKLWLKKNKKYPVIKMDWLMFGTSGQLKHQTDKLLIEQYDTTWGKRLTIGKSIYNCSFDILGYPTFSNIVHHGSPVKYGPFIIFPFNDTGNISLWFEVECEGKSRHTIQINHYYSRSLSGLQLKLNSGDPAYGKRKIKMQEYLYREDMNKTKDFTIQRFLLKLKIKVQEIKI